MTTHDPQLDDGRLVRNALEDSPHASALEAVDQAIGGFIVAGYTDQRGGSPQGGNVQGNVGSATRAVLDVIDLDHRHRRLRGNP
ncbi:hypothetical protein D3C81_2089930 [compost metagenome]